MTAVGASKGKICGAVAGKDLAWHVSPRKKCIDRPLDDSTEAVVVRRASFRYFSIIV